MFTVTPGELFLQLLVGSVGFGLFVYGKKSERLPHLIAGLLLMVYPYFVSGTWLTVVFGALIGGGLMTAMWMGW